MKNKVAPGRAEFTNLSMGGSFNAFISYLVKKPDQTNNEGHVFVVKTTKKNPPGFEIKASIQGKAKELKYDFDMMFMTVTSKKDLKL